MPEENYQKIKLLKIMEILRQEADEEPPMTKVELAARLVAMNVSCSPRSLIRDIKLLNEQGYEIMERLIGHEKGYFVCDRSFSVPELKILIDAMQAASFVTEKKTAELVDKIGSRYQLVNLVAKRARELSAEAEEEEMPLERKAVSSAIDEVYTGKLSIEHEEE